MDPPSCTQSWMASNESWISVRIRATGAKGPSPWSEAAVIRINQPRFSGHPDSLNQSPPHPFAQPMSAMRNYSYR